MFKHYFIIEYNNLYCTLNTLGITREEYDRMRDQKPLYMHTSSMITHCTKQELKTLMNKILDIEDCETIYFKKISKFIAMSICKYPFRPFDIAMQLIEQQNQRRILNGSLDKNSR